MTSAVSTLTPLLLRLQRRAGRPSQASSRCPGVDSRDGGCELGTIEVELGHPERLLRFAELAAAPRVGIIDGGEQLRLAVRAPGATPENTEVRWDEATKQLLVGVWCGRNPRPSGRPKFPPPELIWFHGVYLPECQGKAAKARVESGTVTIELPKTTSARAAWRPLELDAARTGFRSRTETFYRRPERASANLGCHGSRSLSSTS